METATLYPELMEYIYQYADQFKTANEKLAAKTALYRREALNEKVLRLLKTKGWYSDDNVIREMIADGYESFKRKVAQRIYDEHKDELELNLCPKCNKITRTPESKQCRFCYHDWH